MNNSYISYLQAAKKSQRTIDTYTDYVNKMSAFINKPDEEIKTVDLMNWQASISHLSSATVHLQVSAIKSYFKFLKKIGVRNDNPALELETPSVKSKEKPYMNCEDIRAMVNASRTARDKAIILTFCTTGLRVSELSNITLKDYGQAKITREIAIVGKGAKHRVVYLNNETMSAIDDYLATRNDDCPYLFTTFRRTQLDECALSQTMKSTAKRAGLSYWNQMNNHSLRAAFATSQSEIGTPVADIQAGLGHSSLSVTSKYIKHSQARINNMMAQSAF